MRKLFPWHVEQKLLQEGDRLAHLKQNLSQLSPEELQELRQFLKTDPAA